MQYTESQLWSVRSWRPSI